jgi:hypothetical protein
MTRSTEWTRIARLVGRLYLCDGRLADRNELIGQVGEYSTQVGVASRDHHQLESCTRTRPFRFDGGPHCLLGQPGQQRLGGVFGHLDSVHRANEVIGVKLHHPLGDCAQQRRSGLVIERCCPVGQASTTVHPEVGQPARAVLRQQFDRGITQFATPLLDVGLPSHRSDGSLSARVPHSPDRDG